MNNIDYIEELDAKNAVSLAEREHKGSPAVFLFSSSLSATTKDGISEKIDSNEINNAAIFSQNLK